ncbi:hypothetical protein pben1_p06 [Paracoccus phage vB_PbeS_Pben1]|uniref:Morphogenetic protein n=1 Tax=Paracoccus versutus TaxID=34007 RepID=A0A3D9XPB7_PARVE|nr:hypothetical protein [Paracoccus versutus]AZV00163.1 hypothetical protein pben1_p06 [Paracoccus phage vB_PbeS_Pben1]REF72280.1 hypothetical protein BDD41_0749 [Paracoccus versutus]WGR55735.1 hypothetical protein E3U25_07095 [Paracoccus versutus]
MADRPILFSAPMVRAILREIAAPGTGKTQTRRLLNVDPAWHLDQRRRAAAEAGHYWFTEDLDMPGGLHVVPRFAPGDRLWVREAWCLDAQMDHVAPSKCSPYEPRGYPANDWIIEPACMMIRAGKLRPGIHMPRWASRLTLHVTDVRVQRLQDISEDDARAEGIERLKSGRGYYDHTVSKGAVRAGIWHHKATDAFEVLWDSLNAERAPWASNPWVVAVTFRPVLTNIDSEEGQA